MVYELWTRNNKTKQIYQLSGEYKTKQKGQKVVNTLKSKQTNYIIGQGRGFSTKEEAIKWKKNALKNPPLGLTKKEYNKKLTIKHKPSLTTPFLRKRKKFWKWKKWVFLIEN